MPTPSEILRQQRAVENATAAAMESLLRAAAAETSRRLAELPLDSPTAVAYRQVGAALDDAANRLGFAMGSALSQGSQQAATLGVQLAEATLASGAAGGVGGTAGAAAVPLFLPTTLLEPLAVYQASLIRGLTDELRNDVTRVVQVGMLSGAPKEEIVRQVVAAGLEAQPTVSPFQSAEARAEVITRTEINRVSNLATHERGKVAAQRLPGLTKTWVTAGDARVRETHRAVSGRTIPFEEDFTVGGHPAAHPLDARLPASEAVHCRCRLRYHAPEPAPVPEGAAVLSG